MRGTFVEMSKPRQHRCRSVPLERYIAALEQSLSSVDEIRFRPLGRNGVELVIGLARSPAPGTLRLLAEHKDRAGLIERALAAEDFASDYPPTFAKTRRL